MPETIGILSKDVKPESQNNQIFIQNNNKMIPFVLLSKSIKNKPTLNKIELPSDSNIVINAKQRIKDEQQERNEVKEQTILQMQVFN